MKKKIKTIISVLLSVFVVLLLGVNILSLTTRGNNFGVPKIANTSFLHVYTDSMEPTLKVNTLIVVKDVDPSTLVAQEVDEQGNVIVEGDVITFYRTSDNKVITHRLLGKTLNSDGTYTLECFGDNMYASSCGPNGCYSKPHDYINSEYLIGKVVSDSYAAGVVYTFITQPVVSFLLIMIPGGYVVVSALIEFIKQAKLLHTENQLEKERKEQGLETHEEELERLKNEMKQKYLEELKKENLKDKEDE